VGADTVSNRPILLMSALAALSLVPLLVIMVTSFVKITVVLTIVRQSTGTQNIPPTTAITGMAMILTAYIMAPVVLEGYHRGQASLLARGVTELDLKQIEPVVVEDLGQIMQQPLRNFLIKNADTKESAFFFRMAKAAREGRAAEEVTIEDFAVITPAFVMTELKEAFQIGFVFYVPMLIVDMVVANILMALGMQMLSPTTISLPFKLLLFVVADGWYLLAKGLVLGYA